MSPDKCFQQVGVVRVTWPRIFWELNANSSKTAEGTNFKFGRHIPRYSPDMTTDKSFRNVGVARVTWPRKFLGVKCYSFKTAKDTNFKFVRRVPWDSPNMSCTLFGNITSNLAGVFPGIVPTWPLTKVSETWAWPESRDPVNFWALNANSSKMAKVIIF